MEPLEDRTVPAATFTVTNLNDAGPGSLRQATLDSNAAAGADNITFQPGLSGIITLDTGTLHIGGSVTITGPGAGVLTINGKDRHRIFVVAAFGTLTVSISGLTLTNGNAGVGPNTDEPGGAIVTGTTILTLTDLVITKSVADRGGGIHLGEGSQLRLEGSTVDGNFAKCASRTPPRERCAPC